MSLLIVMPVTPPAVSLSTSAPPENIPVLVSLVNVCEGAVAVPSLVFNLTIFCSSRPEPMTLVPPICKSPLREILPDVVIAAEDKLPVPRLRLSF